MKCTNNKISLIIPVYNEASILKNNVLIIEDAIKRIVNSYEIIIAEDGSKDGTNIVARELSKNNPHIMLSHSEERIGKGGAITKAFKISSGEIIIFMDVDISTSLDFLPIIINNIEKGYDMVIGSRFFKKSIVERKFYRKFFSSCFNTLVRILFKTGVHDHQCGFKAIRSNVFKKVMSNIYNDNFLFDTELIIKLISNKFSIAEIPVIWKEPKKRKSKFKILRDAPRMGIELLKLRVKLWRT